jgi:hypothetical protein
MKENLLIIYKMDYFPRMTNFGQRIISPNKSADDTYKKPVYPFNSPVKPAVMPVMPQPISYSPVHPSAYSTISPMYGNPYPYIPYSPYPVQPFNSSPAKLDKDIKSQIKDLKRNVARKQQVERNKMFVEKMNSMLTVLEPKPAVEQKQPENDKFLELLSLMQRQQENILELIKSGNKPVLGPNSPNRAIEQDPIALEARRIEDTYRQFRSDPNKINQILEQVGFKEEEDDLYLDDDKTYKFDPTLPESQKIELLKKLQRDREAREIERRKAQIKGKRKFRVIGYVVLFPIMAFSSMMERKSRSKLANIKTMEESIKVYIEVGKSWVIKAVRNPLISVLNDPSLDLNIASKDRMWSNSAVEANKMKVMKLQVRIRGILEGFRDNTTEVEMPGPFRLFLGKLTSQGTFLPGSYLLPFEKSRLEFDSFGALKSQSDSKKKMMISFFLITRILIGMLLLKPEESGLPTRKNGKVTQ